LVEILNLAGTELGLGLGFSALLYPITSNTNLEVQMLCEEYLQIMYMLFCVLQFGGYSIDTGTLESCSKFPEGEIQDGFV
jgi:uncharacterized membrane protein